MSKLERLKTSNPQVIGSCISYALKGMGLQAISRYTGLSVPVVREILANKANPKILETLPQDVQDKLAYTSEPTYSDIQAILDTQQVTKKVEVQNDLQTLQSNIIRTINDKFASGTATFKDALSAARVVNVNTVGAVGSEDPRGKQKVEQWIIDDESGKFVQNPAWQAAIGGDNKGVLSAQQTVINIGKDVTDAVVAKTDAKGGFVVDEHKNVIAAKQSDGSEISLQNMDAHGVEELLGEDIVKTDDKDTFKYLDDPLGEIVGI